MAKNDYSNFWMFRMSIVTITFKSGEQRNNQQLPATSIVVFLLLVRRAGNSDQLISENNILYYNITSRFSKRF